MSSGTRFSLTLFVNRANSAKALADLYDALRPIAYDAYKLRLVDVDKSPEQAAELDVRTTPVLIVHSDRQDQRLEQLDVASIRGALGI